MTTVDELREQIRSISPVDEREATSIEATLARLGWPGDPFDEAGDSHHVTASALLISSRGVILHRHRRLGIWVQPGGHVDSGEDVLDAAVRETREETGLRVRHREPVTLFNVDVHPGPRGHTHYDLRYVLVAPPIDPDPAPGESPDVFWFAFHDAIERCESSLVPVLEKLHLACIEWDVAD